MLYNSLAGQVGLQDYARYIHADLAFLSKMTIKMEGEKSLYRLHDTKIPIEMFLSLQKGLLQLHMHAQSHSLCLLP